MPCSCIKQRARSPKGQPRGPPAQRLRKRSQNPLPPTRGRTCALPCLRACTHAACVKPPGGRRCCGRTLAPTSERYMESQAGRAARGSASHASTCDAMRQAAAPRVNHPRARGTHSDAGMRQALGRDAPSHLRYPSHVRHRLIVRQIVRRVHALRDRGGARKKQRACK